jgi:IclR family transcriptional regulator, acetate operon repressor
MEDSSDKDSVLAKLADILDAFGQAPYQYTFTEVSVRTNVSKASVHRLMAQLVEVGFLEKAGTGKTYKLGQRLTRLLHFNLRRDILEAIFTPEIQNVADSVSEAAFAARLNGADVELFAVQGPSGQSLSFMHPGLGVRPIHACSSAKCILAYQSETVLADLLDRNLPSFTDATIIEKGAILSELEEVRRAGFAVCDEEIEKAIYSIAFPVYLEGAGVIYSIGVIAPKGRISEERLAKICARLRTASERISEFLNMSCRSPAT